VIPGAARKHLAWTGFPHKRIDQFVISAAAPELVEKSRHSGAFEKDFPAALGTMGEVPSIRRFLLLSCESVDVRRESRTHINPNKYLRDGAATVCFPTMARSPLSSLGIS
jgi:hypothetical protein